MLVSNVIWNTVCEGKLSFLPRREACSFFDLVKAKGNDKGPHRERWFEEAAERVCYSRYNLTASSALLESHDHDLSLIHKCCCLQGVLCMWTVHILYSFSPPLLSKITFFRQHQMTYLVLWWGILVTCFFCLSLSFVPSCLALCHFFPNSFWC